jgi:hypothetical protein
MSDKKQTAVEWLLESVQSELSEPMSSKFKDLFDQAKQIEREQIEDAYYEGKQNIPSKTPDEYYDQTYGE